MNELGVIPDPIGGWREPWPRVFEIARALPADRWMLVGGLMVQVHALAAGIETNRVTLDVDAAVRIDTKTFNYTEAASALLRLGYASDDSTRYTYRFVRGAEVIDLMVADHERPAPRYGRREVMQVTGGRQALARLCTVRFALDDGDVSVPLPTLHGALVLKAAAHIVDSRDRDRHLLDAITLLACLVDVASIIDDMRGSDRRRLSHVVRACEEQPLVIAQAPSDTLRLARRALEELRGSLR